MKYICQACKSLFPDELSYCPTCLRQSSMKKVIDGDGELVPTTQHGTRVEGPHHMGVFAFDLSPSMGDGIEGGGRKIDLVAREFAATLDELQHASEASDVRISLIGFANTARVLSEWWLPEVKGRTDAERMNLVLEPFTKGGLGGGTNITAGLEEAARVMRRAIDGRDSVRLLSETVRYGPGRDKMRAMVPNIRAFIYSDGEHNAGALKSPFDDFVLAPEMRWPKVSGLMTMFLGRKPPEGAEPSLAEKQMRALAGNCPVHDRPGFFTVHSEAEAKNLRRVFRTVSRGSGFCDGCARPR